MKCTTFEKVMGKDFYPGMLIREIKSAIILVHKLSVKAKS